MSDDEEQMHEAPSGPSEAELAMQKRRKQQVSSSGLDDAAQELLEENRQMRKEMEKEIQEMRERSERRKREREEEEKRIAEARAEEEARRKADEEERKSKKDGEERAKREARAAKLAEFEKWKNPPKRNFVISKREDGSDSVQVEGDETQTEQKKSKEQLEAEKRAILDQRLQPLNIDGFDASKLTDKAKELHTLVMRLEGEKYDLEKRFKNQQVDMQEMAERARQMNKVGKGEGSVKRIATKEDETDAIQDKYAGAPAKIMMYSAFERQKDKRTYKDRHTIFIGPMYGYPADRIKPGRRVDWNDQGQPIYIEGEGGDAPAAAEAAAEEEE